MAPRFKFSQRWVGWLAATAFLLLVTSPAMAGQTGTGTVTGTGDGRERCRAAWRDGDDDESGVAGSAGDDCQRCEGRYRLTPLPIGTYTVLSSYPDSGRSGVKTSA